MRWLALLGLLIVLVSPPIIQALPAFPTAEGFGQDAIGGRNATTIPCHVTSLADFGLGSLRQCILASGARTIVFDTSGNIECLGGSGHDGNTMYVSNGQLTIAGETAPGQGVTAMCGILFLRADDVIVRHFRFRPGAVGSGTRHPMEDPESMTASQINGGKRVIFDHVSISWSTDDSIAIVQDYNENNDAVATVQWSFIAEPIRLGGKGADQSKCFAMGSYTSPTDTKATYHHNLFAYCNDRNPFATGSWIQWENNLIFDYGIEANIGPFNTAVTAQAIGNTYQPGLDPAQDVAPISIWGCGGEIADRGACGRIPSCSIYVHANIHPTFRPNNTYADDAILDHKFDTSFPVITTPQPGFPVLPSTTTDAAAAATAVLASAGALPSRRDPVDTRIANQVNAGTGHWIVNSETEVGGYPTLPILPRAGGYDSDNDGMPDTWEVANGLNPTNAADGQTVTGDGYTNLEHYLHAAAGEDAPPPPTKVVGIYYIATTGTDAVDCTAAQASSTPRLTLANVAPCAAAGSTIIYAAGTYRQSHASGTTPIDGGTDAAHPTTIKAAPGATVILQWDGGGTALWDFNTAATDTYMVLDHLIMEQTTPTGAYGFTQGFGHHITVQNSEIRNFTNGGVLIYEGGVNNFTLANSWVHGGTATGGLITMGNCTACAVTDSTIEGGGGPGMSPFSTYVNPDVRVERNRIQSNTGAGLVLSATTGAFVANNIVSQNGGAGIVVPNGSSGAKLYNNDAWNNTGVGIQVVSGANSAEVINNIVWLNTGGAITDAGTGTVGLAPQTNFLTDPFFVNPPTDFQLDATTVHVPSALQSGTTLASVTVDQAGFARTVPYSMGAREQDATAGPPPTTVRIPAYGPTGAFLQMQ
jgi:parallel beta-helix repeat protein